MKKLYFITWLSAFCGLSQQTNSQNLLWAKQMSGTGSDIAFSSAVDASGNIYTTGFFHGIADFDPGPGTFNMTSNGGQEIFISKLDASGNFVWAKQIGSTGDDFGDLIVLDANANVYITGTFENIADFDPGTGVNNLTSLGTENAFILKLDSSGNFIFVKQMGGTGITVPYYIALDGSGYIYTTGRFDGTADFDPGIGTYNFFSFGSEDIFVSKLDASGNFIWAKQMGGTGDDWSLSIAIDAIGNVYTTGYFQNIADFDPGTGVYNFTFNGVYDIFISKLDASGNFIWAKQMGGLSYDRGLAIVLDANANVYSTGLFRGTVDFDPGSGTFNMTAVGGPSNEDIYVSKLDSSGNFMWAKQMGGIGIDIGRAIAVDTHGNVYTTGWFQGIADFDPGIGTYNLTSDTASEDIFVTKLDPSGNFLSAVKMGGAGYDAGNGIFIDGIGNVYIAGQFQDTANFNTGSGINNLVSTGSDDICVVKLDSSAVTAIAEIKNSFNTISVFPNPGAGKFSITNSNIISEIKITNTLGQLIYQTKPNEKYFSLQIDEVGIYFIQITANKQTTTKKLIVCK
ncbi:MAG: SBBP repeat-containing protein [Bacteroidota bacterium]